MKQETRRASRGGERKANTTAPNLPPTAAVVNRQRTENARLSRHEAAMSKRRKLFNDWLPSALSEHRDLIRYFPPEALFVGALWIGFKRGAERR